MIKVKSKSDAERQSRTETDETLDIMQVRKNRRNYLGTCKTEAVCSKATATASAFLFLHTAYLRPTSPLRSPSPSAKMSATKLLVYSASVLSGATILACIIACGVLLQDINNLYTNVLEEMDGFRVTANAAWKEMQNDNVYAKSLFGVSKEQRREKRGAQCNCAAQSAQCPQGPPGPPGAPGAPGDAGSPGEPGQSGLAGISLVTSEGGTGCIQCPAGPPGPPGPDGTPGAPGPDGNPGAPGQSAGSSPPGPPGPPGPAGSPGQAGQPGNPGSNGNDATNSRGTPGPAGPQGPAGTPGQDGSPGQDGNPGQDGYPGGPGPNGNPGQAGAPGQPGQPGQSGNPGGDSAYCPCPPRGSAVEGAHQSGGYRKRARKA